MQRFTTIAKKQQQLFRCLPAVLLLLQALSQQNGRLMTHLAVLDHQRGVLMTQVGQGKRGRGAQALLSALHFHKPC